MNLWLPFVSRIAAPSTPRFPVRHRLFRHARIPRATGSGVLAAAAAALVLALSGSAVLADRSVTLAWNPNPEPDIAGYRVHHGTTSGAWTTTVDVGNTTTATIDGLPDDRTVFFVLTAYNTAGLESIPSEEVASAPRTPEPKVGEVEALADFRVRLHLEGPAGRDLIVETSSDHENWSELARVPNPNGTVEFIDPRGALAPDGPPRFYRITRAE